MKDYLSLSPAHLFSCIPFFFKYYLLSISKRRLFVSVICNVIYFQTFFGNQQCNWTSLLLFGLLPFHRVVVHRHINLRLLKRWALLLVQLGSAPVVPVTWDMGQLKVRVRRRSFKLEILPSLIDGEHTTEHSGNLGQLNFLNLFIDICNLSP